MAKIVRKEPHQECEPTYEKVFARIEEGWGTVGESNKGSLSEDPRDPLSEELLTEVYAPIE